MIFVPVPVPPNNAFGKERVPSPELFEATRTALELQLHLLLEPHEISIPLGIHPPKILVSHR